MTPLEHLTVLISIVIGLGIAQLLISVHRLALARRRVRLYWLAIMWVVLLFVAQVEWWWSIFAIREEINRRPWNFFYFLFVLLSPVSLYLAAAFALPEIAPEESYDLREYYYDSRGWFFAMVAIGPALDAVRRGLQLESWADTSVWSNAVSAVLVTTLAVSRKPWLHIVVTLITAALFGEFLLSSALQLR